MVEREIIRKRGPNSQKFKKEFLGDNPEEKLRGLIDDGFSLQQIADNLQQQYPDLRTPSKSTIHRWINPPKIKKPGGFKSNMLKEEFLGDNHKAELRRLYEKIGTAAGVAHYLQEKYPDKMAPSDRTITNWLKREGIITKRVWN